VTLGLRARANYVRRRRHQRIPLDDIVVAIKGPNSRPLAGQRTRLVPFDVQGYGRGVGTAIHGRIWSGWTRLRNPHRRPNPKSAQPEEKTMLHEGIHCAHVGQGFLAAIRKPGHRQTPRPTTSRRWSTGDPEIDRRRSGRATAPANRAAKNSVSEAPRRTGYRRRQVSTKKESVSQLRKTVRPRPAPGRTANDLGIPGDRATNGARISSSSKIYEADQGMQALLGARREAEARIADLEQSLHSRAQHETSWATATNTLRAKRAMRRLPRKPASPPPACSADKELDELDSCTAKRKSRRGLKG